MESGNGCSPPERLAQDPEEKHIDLNSQYSATDYVRPSDVTDTSVRLQHPLFATKQLGVDRRLLVNRKRQLKMYRVWMQGQFRKIDHSGENVGIE
jgi:tRNAThr (cytosine32-N3)-methyltransferase